MVGLLAIYIHSRRPTADKARDVKQGSRAQRELFECNAIYVMRATHCDDDANDKLSNIHCAYRGAAHQARIKVIADGAEKNGLRLCWSHN